MTVMAVVEQTLVRSSMPVQAVRLRYISSGSTKKFTLLRRSLLVKLYSNVNDISVAKWGSTLVEEGICRLNIVGNFEIIRHHACCLG